MTTLSATILITTKNRKDDLRSALQSAFAQTADCEVLVIDDGSSDGTSDMVKAEFPEARLVTDKDSKGYIVQRNRGAELATGDIIFSIDDDAIFTSPKTVSQTLAEFSHPRIGAVAIPFVNVKYNDVVRQIAPSDANVFVTASYIGTAHAIKRNLFLKLGGYRPVLFHQGEEGDYCIRLLDEGYVVRLGMADPIHHFESPLRDFTRLHLYGPRNSVLFGWQNVPMPEMPLHLLFTSVNNMRHGFRIGKPGLKAKGLMMGYASLIKGLCQRQPVKQSTYRLFRKLKSKPHLLADVETYLPTIEN
jgi:glycosyltransferase involved in cell wall biosynthesis